MTNKICGIEFVEKCERYWDKSIDGHKYVTWNEAMLPGNLRILLDDTRISIIDDEGTIFQTDRTSEESIRDALRFVRNKFEKDAALLQKMILDTFAE